MIAPADVGTRLHARGEPVRAVRLVGRETAAVIRCRGADPIAEVPRRVYGKPATHAVAGDADTIVTHGRLCGEMRQQRLGVAHDVGVAR